MDQIHINTQVPLKAFIGSTDGSLCVLTGAGTGADGACGDVQSCLDLYEHTLLHKGDDHGCDATRRPAGQLLRL